MIVVRALLVCGVLAFVAGHASGQQQQAPRPPATPESGAPQPGGQEGQGAGGRGGEGASQGARIAGDVERGRYLVEQVAMCVECHSTRDARGQIVEGRQLRGGPMPVSPPSWAAEEWPLYIPRIAGLPGYTDEQAMRLLTQGSIDRNGRQLRPPMPRFRMTPQDAAAAIAYLRSR